MKVKIHLEIHADIPGEFQNDAEAVQLLQNEIDELFEIGCEYEKEDQPSVMFESAKIKMYIPGAGKL
jgi:FtsZ-binding cell division protein ZapB